MFSRRIEETRDVIDVRGADIAAQVQQLAERIEQLRQTIAIGVALVLLLFIAVVGVKRA